MKTKAAAMAEWDGVDAAIAKLPLRAGADRSVSVALASTEFWRCVVDLGMPRSNRGASKRLSNISKLAERLAKELRLVDDDLRGWLFSKEVLPALAELSQRAKNWTDRIERDPAAGSKNPDAQRVANAAAAAYELYTGKFAHINTHPVTGNRYGDFVQFVDDLFGALGISDGKPSYFAQKALVSQNGKS